MLMVRSIVIWGDDSHNTLGVIRSIGQTGKRVQFVNNTPNKHVFVPFSMYVENAYFTSTLNEGMEAVLKIG